MHWGSMKTRYSGKHLYPRNMRIQKVKYMNTKGEKHGIHDEVLLGSCIETITSPSRSQESRLWRWETNKCLRTVSDLGCLILVSKFQKLNCKITNFSTVCFMCVAHLLSAVDTRLLTNVVLYPIKLNTWSCTDLLAGIPLLKMRKSI
jgi:hypothetical protein